MQEPENAAVEEIEGGDLLALHRTVGDLIKHVQGLTADILSLERRVVVLEAN